ncbi:hypothetical protein Bca52824_060343 [Brassica carinata]|uniref:Pentatricopeptide repeat-containing protein n=1 Tax=Brassica carinata TaxID=52824 RepID=A0A8X7R1A1_BRACI|nr:hypothetical protein Bca52824_060343 [Brassica carinata]
MLSILTRNMYDQAHEILQSIRDHELNLDLVTYNSLMDIYVRRGECWKAEEILNSLDNPSWDLVSYNTVITDFCRKGMMQEAVRMLSEMTGRGIRPCVFTYNTFVSGYTAMGMFGEIEDVIECMAKNECRPNELTYKMDTNKDADFKLNWKRVAITSMFGLGFVGNVGHFWYGGLDIKALICTEVNTFCGTVAAKVAMDGLIFGPIDLLIFFT